MDAIQAPVTRPAPEINLSPLPNELFEAWIDRLAQQIRAAQREDSKVAIQKDTR